MRNREAKRAGIVPVEKPEGDVMDRMKAVVATDGTDFAEGIIPCRNERVVRLLDSAEACGAVGSPYDPNGNGSRLCRCKSLIFRLSEDRFMGLTMDNVGDKEVTSLEIGVRASGWFFAGYNHFSRFFTIFHAIFQRQGFDFSPVTKITGLKRCSERDLEIQNDGFLAGTRRVRRSRRARSN